MSLTIRTQSVEQTRELGTRLADQLTAGDVLALIGDLGVGKTHLVQAIAARRGVDSESVRSPTFTLIHEYDVSPPLYHIDAYRLRDHDEFLELGAEELLHGEGICLVEWADRVEAVLPPHSIVVRITATGVNEREWCFDGEGPRALELLSQLQSS